MPSILAALCDALSVSTNDVDFVIQQIYDKSLAAQCLRLAIGMALLFYALIQIIIGIGLLFLQPWARVLCIFFSALGVLILLPGLLHLHPIAVVSAR